MAQEPALSRRRGRRHLPIRNYPLPRMTSNQTIEKNSDFSALDEKMDEKRVNIISSPIIIFRDCVPNMVHNVNR
jgi:hypothetical protein